MATTAPPGAHHKQGKATALVTLAVGLLAAGVLAVLVTVGTGSSTQPSTDPAPVEQTEATQPTTHVPQRPARDEPLDHNAPGAMATERSTVNQTVNPNGPGALATEHSTGTSP